MRQLYALIIEDNSSDTAVLQSLLSRLNVRYDVIADSRQVASILPQIDPPPNVIFLDLELPGLNGYDVLQRIRALPKYAQVPVVAYTAHSAEMSYARNAGFHSFLGKPLRGAEFADQLERILNDVPVWEIRE